MSLINKRFLLLMVGFVICSSSLVFGKITVPSVNYIFLTSQTNILSGGYVSGEIVSFEYSDENIFTGIRKISNVIIGGKEGTINIIMNGYNEGDLTLGENIIIQTPYGILINHQNKTGFGVGKIVLGDFTIINDVPENMSIPKHKSKLTVDQYFDDNIAYGQRNIQLQGRIVELSSNDNLYIVFGSESGLDITCFYDKWRWASSEAIKNEIRMLKVNSIITVTGMFLLEAPTTSIFDITSFVIIE